MSTMWGKCLCEAVSYEIDGGLGPVFNCHCSKCRRWHGAAYRTRASIHVDQFRWLSGEEQLVPYASSDNVTKYFCKTCGSPLISTYKDKPDVLGIPLGGLEGDVTGQPVAHIFTAHKAEWHAIADALPQYEGWPDSEERVRETESS